MGYGSNLLKGIYECDAWLIIYIVWLSCICDQDIQNVWRKYIYAAFEKEANKNYGKLSESFPKGSINILSPDILNILITNARKSNNTDYKSGDTTYTVTFSSYTKLEKDGIEIGKNIIEMPL